jgi:hypothetical protein
MEGEEDKGWRKKEEQELSKEMKVWSSKDVRGARGVKEGGNRWKGRQGFEEEEME